VPTSRQIWVTQEDLWAYETLLRVIASTNKERGATRPDNTAIRVIQSLEVGAPAAMAMAQESMILMPADAMPAGGEVPMGPEGGAYGREGGMPGEGVDMDAMLLQNRYIDAEGKPITDASTGMGTEFRRLPIRMVLMMDERWLPKVLVECANSPLPIEVQRLRINREKSGVDKENQAFDLGPSAGAGPGMGGRGYEGGGGRGMERRRHRESCHDRNPGPRLHLHASRPNDSHRAGRRCHFARRIGRRRRGGGSLKGVASREFRVARKMQQRYRESRPHSSNPILVTRNSLL
jgi:hypothetical protein